MKKPLYALLPLLPLALGSCLENEEKIEIKADGSVSIELAVKGDEPDLATGYALPLHAPWQPINDEARTWLAKIGPDTGSPSVRARLEDFEWPEGTGEQPTLRVRADFASVADIPRFFAPPSEIYRTAYLERSAELTIEERGGRTVYTFERRFHARAYRGLSSFDHVTDELPEIDAKMKDNLPLTEAEWKQVEDGFDRAARSAAERGVRNAIVGIYTEGDADVPARAIEVLIRDVGKRAAEAFDIDELRSIYEQARLDVADEAADEVGERVDGIERRFRQAIRSAVIDWMEATGVAEKTRNAILYSVEWGFTAFDHTEDLGDEKFAVQVTMPGTVVGGNFDGFSGRTASWSFESGVVRDRDFVMRVISVVD